MKRLVFVLLVMFCQSCVPIQVGYILKPVDMYQARIGSCGSSLEIHAVSRPVAEQKCNNRLGCTFFETKKNPVQIWYAEGHQEILAHEMFHCEVGGPLHEGELMVAGRAVSAEWLDPYRR